MRVNHLVKPGSQATKSCLTTVSDAPGLCPRAARVWQALLTQDAGRALEQDIHRPLEGCHVAAGVHLDPVLDIVRSACRHVGKHGCTLCFWVLHMVWANCKHATARSKAGSPHHANSRQIRCSGLQTAGGQLRVSKLFCCSVRSARVLTDCQRGAQTFHALAFTSASNVVNAK